MTNDSPRWFLPGLDPDWGHKHLSVAWFLFPDTLDQMKEMMKKGDKRTLRVLFPAHQPELGGGGCGNAEGSSEGLSGGRQHPWQGASKDGCGKLE